MSQQQRDCDNGDDAPGPVPAIPRRLVLWGIFVAVVGGLLLWARVINGPIP